MLELSSLFSNSVKACQFGIIGHREVLAEFYFCLVEVFLSSSSFLFSFLKHLHKVKISDLHMCIPVHLKTSYKFRRSHK